MNACWFGCKDRKTCYESVSRKNLGNPAPEFHCASPDGGNGYRFSKAMENPGFISVDDIQNIYMPMGFSNFKIEGRGLGSALILEFLLYYMTKPEYQLHVREEIYLDNMLDLFSHGDRVFDFFIVPSGSKMNAKKPASRQVFLHSNLFLFSFAFLYLKRLQIIRHIQIAMIILLSFLRIQLLSLRQMCLFCMIQQQIRHTEFFRKLACFFLLYYDASHKA